MQRQVLDEEDEEEDDDAPVYNPLNLPLGWDGKPIPFWLYKLHGESFRGHNIRASIGWRKG